MEYNLYAYEAGQRIGVVEGVDSLQWQLCARAPGEAKLVVNDSPKNRLLLKTGNLLQNSDYPDKAMMIVQKEAQQSGAQIRHIVRAVELSALLGRRVLLGTQNVGNVETAMRAIVTNNLRGLPLTLAPATGITTTLDTQISWGSVLDAIQKLAEVSGLCFETIFDQAAGGQLRIYQGANRTAGNQYIGYFGDDMGNLEALEIDQGEYDYRNRAIVAGEGEGAARVVVNADIDVTEPRREVYVDAKDISSKYQVATPTGQNDPTTGAPIYAYSEQSYTATQYAEKLRARGLEKLRDLHRTTAARAMVNDTVMRYGKDYHLGDILPVQSKAMGILLYAEIETITIIYEQMGKKIKAGLRFE